jgi:hypothetical protein
MMPNEEAYWSLPPGNPVRIVQDPYKHALLALVEFDHEEGIKQRVAFKNQLYPACPLPKASQPKN